MTGASAELDARESGAALGADVHGRSLLQNAGILFIGQAVGLVAPLLTIPYLARVLGPGAWGPVLAAQALSNWMILVLDFAFELSGTRAVARVRTAPDALADVVHGVRSAQFLLMGAAVPIALTAWLAIPALRANTALLLCAVAFAVVRGINPLWFFQGVERIKGAVLVETLSRAAAAFGVFFVVRSPADGWRVVALQAVFAAASLVVLSAWMTRYVPYRAPRIAAALPTLRSAASIFATRASSGFYIQANALILSALATPVVVGFFGGAERIIRAAINLLQPLTQAFLPRVSFLHGADPAAAEQTVRRSLWGVGSLGGIMGATAIFGAPTLVHLVLGNGYEAAIPVLRILGLLAPVTALNTVIGIYWALPFGHDRALLNAILAAGAANIIFALVLVPFFGALGMAISAVVAELVVFACLTSLYLRRGR